MGWYKNWFGSPYYKILYQNRDEAEAQQFVEQLLNYLQPPASCAMLDIACGEGRFAKQLAEHGFNVTGIDISQEAIAIAKASENENLQFFVQDMRMPFYINFFDYAFNFFTSFGYFAHDRDHALAARSFAASLKPGGTLVIDYLNYQHVLANFVAEEQAQRGSYTFNIKRTINRGHITKEISFVDAGNNKCQYSESVAAFTQQDFINFFEASNMILVNTFGDYKLGAYDAKTSPRLIMIFKKKHV